MSPHHCVSFFRFLLLLGFGLFSLPAFADLDLQAPLPVDTSVKIGHLKNGLTYYIKKNDDPKQKVELRLVVKFGSVHESDEQQGAAHFLEHLAFKNTRNFKNDTVRSTLENIGLQFGRDLNAFTEFELTRYEITLPSAKREHLKLGLQALADFAGNVEIRAADIVAEEAIIAEEQRLRNNLEMRKTFAIYDLTLQETKFPARSPIGLEGVRKKFTATMLQQLYRQRYRPDHMAVIVVGDIEPRAVEKLLQQLFAVHTNPLTVVNDTPQKVPEFAESDLKIFSDPQQSTHDLELIYAVTDTGSMQTVGEMREAMIRSFYFDLLRKRMGVYDRSFQSAGAGRFHLFRGKKRQSVMIDYAKAGDASSIKLAMKTAINATYGRLAQVRQYGFLESELNERRQEKQNAYEQAYIERDKKSSNSFVDDYLDHFVMGENLLSTAQVWKLMQAIYPTISLAEVNKVATTQFPTASPVRLLYSAPKTDEALLPSKQEILASIAEAEQQKVAQVIPRARIASLLKTPPASAGNIVAENDNILHGTTEWKLSNGVTVILKKTDFTNNKISMFHQRLGGSSSGDVNDFLSMSYAPVLTGEMGFDNLAPRDVQEFLKPKSVWLKLNVSHYATTISGTSSVADIETLLQWNYQRITNPSRNKILFSMGIGDIKRNLQKMLERPEWIIHDQYTKLAYGNNLRATFIPRLESVETLNMDKVIANYDQLHRDFSGSYFVFVGNVDAETMRPLVRKYLANLPGNSSANLTKQDKQDKQDQINYPLPVRGIVKKEIFVGQDNKASVRITFSGAFKYNDDEKIRFVLLTDILRLRLNQSLREEKKLIYASALGGEFLPISGGRYQLSFVLPCAVEQTDAVIQALFEEVQNLKKNPPSIAELNKVKKAWEQMHKESLRDDDYWAKQLLDAKLNTQTVSLLFAPEKLLNVISPESIRLAANQYLDQQNYIQLVAKPESAATMAQEEIEAYKKFVPRDLGLRQMRESYLKSLNLGTALTEAIRKEKAVFVYADKSVEHGKLKQLQDQINKLNVSSCLLPAKQVQLDFMRNLSERFELVKTPVAVNDADSEIMPDATIKRYFDALGANNKLTEVINQGIAQCEDGAK